MNESDLTTCRNADEHKVPEVPVAHSRLRLFGKRIKLVWNGPEKIRARWHLALFAFYDRAIGERFGGIAISVRGVLLWGLLGGVAGYHATAGILYWIRSSNKYNQVTYADVLAWPFQRARMRELTGQTLLAEAAEHLKRGRYAEGIHAARAGLAAYPYNYEMRLLLAHIYALTGQRTLALRTLKLSLGEPYPGRAYVAKVLAFAKTGHDYPHAVEFIDSSLTSIEKERHSADVEWLQHQRLIALFDGGMYDQVIEATQGVKLDSASLHKEIRVRALLARGRLNDALELLESWRRSRPAEGGRYLPLLAEVYRKQGIEKSMLQTLDAFCAMTPDHPQPYVFRICMRLQFGTPVALESLLGEFMRRFGKSKESLFVLAKSVGEMGVIEIAAYCLKVAQSNHFDLFPFLVQYQVACLRGNRWDLAKAQLGTLAGMIDPSDKKGRLWLEWQSRLLDCLEGSRKLKDAQFLDFMRSNYLGIEILKDSVQLLKTALRYDLAKEVSAIAQTFFPHEKWDDGRASSSPSAAL